jgi:hypothetical protein
MFRVILLDLGFRFIIQIIYVVIFLYYGSIWLVLILIIDFFIFVVGYFGYFDYFGYFLIIFYGL